jgi:hypothetical protein
MSVSEHLERLFPNLKSTGYKIASPYDPSYNCIAWAAGDTSTWWEPDPMGIYYWPLGIPRRYSLEAYRAVYMSLGYDTISREDFEPGFQKIAILAKAGRPTHASKQLESVHWSSKLGKNVDIEHTFQGLIGDFYGTVEFILKKKM